MLIPTSFPSLDIGSIATSISDPILSILPPPILTLSLHLTSSRSITALYHSMQHPSHNHLKTLSQRSPSHVYLPTFTFPHPPPHPHQKKNVGRMPLDPPDRLPQTPLSTTSRRPPIEDSRLGRVVEDARDLGRADLGRWE
jgi:hypothetical protein